MILQFLIARRTPTIRELIVATPLSLSSPWATGLSAHAPSGWSGATSCVATAAAVSPADPVANAQRCPQVHRPGAPSEVKVPVRHRRDCRFGRSSRGSAWPVEDGQTPVWIFVHPHRGTPISVERAERAPGPRSSRPHSRSSKPSLPRPPESLNNFPVASSRVNDEVEVAIERRMGRDGSSRPGREACPAAAGVRASCGADRRA
jgi:hypothetical protein